MNDEIFNPGREADLELVGYLHRWCVIPRNRQQNQFLHRILSADEPILHDHPWGFRSMILQGGYLEVTPEGEIERKCGDVYDKKADDLHYIKRVDPNTWTMIYTGPTVRDWGFEVNGRWVSHDDYEGRYLTSIFRHGYNDIEDVFFVD